MTQQDVSAEPANSAGSAELYVNSFDECLRHEKKED